MKAAGMAAQHVLAPLFLAALLGAAISFAFNERIVARATAALGAWQKVEYAEVPPDSVVRSNIWVRAGGDLINARTVETGGPAIVLRGVKTIGRASCRGRVGQSVSISVVAISIKKQTKQQNTIN